MAYKNKKPLQNRSIRLRAMIPQRDTHTDIRQTYNTLRRELKIKGVIIRNISHVGDLFQT